MKPGPKPNLTDERRAAIIEAFEKGGTIRIAAGYSRVPLSTLKRWLSRGILDLEEWAEQCDELDDAEPAPELTVYADFALDAAEAIATRDLGWIANLQKEGDSKQWTRWAWLLERTAPNDFALKDGVRRLEITGADGGPVRTEGVQLAAVVSVLQAAGAIEGPVAGSAEGDARPRLALPAPREVLAEPRDG